MPLPSFAFTLHLHHVDAASAARRATFVTPHGPVELPAFMPVATQGSVKGLEIGQLRATGAQMVLANTYHLALRPGEQVVQALGGLHRFMGWDGPILTDSGGFQIFSLARIAKVHEEQAVFRSHVDGRLLEISPERAVAIQEALGGDVAMVLDHVVQLPNEPEVVRLAAARTVRWAARCRAAARRGDQALFGIVQGGLDLDLRADCVRELCRMDFAGYAVGGLSVGEKPDEMYRVLDAVVSELPADRPRYLMGVGRPEDLLEAVRRGIDLFDCVPCPACRRSRGYLRHLFMAREMLGPILLSIHNLTYYQRLLAGARSAIQTDRFEQFRQEKLRGWKTNAAVLPEDTSP
ncbi:MAG: tRNA guanosine(34) transglycosylase Tgt [Thermoguttaceae bacterium]